MTFGEKCQQLRRSRNWTQEELAARIGVSRQALSKWESDTVLPDTENVLRLSDLFGVTTDYLLRPQADDAGSPVSSAASTPSAAPSGHEKTTGRTIAGAVLTAACMLGLVILGIWGTRGDYSICSPDGVTIKQGFRAFLETEHLRWLFWLLTAGLIGGLLALFLPSRRKT